MSEYAYYNENDPKAAAWIRELIKEKVITDGEVDERSIEDVLPADLAGFRRCHFFSGIGVWDYALGLAGWGDRNVWTGSCPCQPFSAAGKREGFADERHLWASWFHLIEVCRPDTIFGEQVASKDGLTWLDLVLSDLEGVSYTTGAVDLPAAGVGAPHIRQRLFFVAHAEASERRQPTGPANERRRATEVRGSGEFDNLANSVGRRRGAQGVSGRLLNELSGKRADESLQITESGAINSLGKDAECVGRRGWNYGRNESETRQSETENQASGHRASGSLEHSASGNTGSERKQRSREHGQRAQDGRIIERLGDADGEQEYATTAGGFHAELSERGFTNGFWRDAEWIYCRDEKYRPIKPGIFPLANGTPGCVALLRGAGNAIVAEAGAEFIRAAKEVIFTEKASSMNKPEK